MPAPPPEEVGAETLAALEEIRNAKLGQRCLPFMLRGDRTGDWAATNVMTKALQSSVFTAEESARLVELLGRLGDTEQPVSKGGKKFEENVGRFHVRAMIEVYSPHADRLAFVFRRHR